MGWSMVPMGSIAFSVESSATGSYHEHKDMGTSELRISSQLIFTLSNLNILTLIFVVMYLCTSTCNASTNHQPADSRSVASEEASIYKEDRSRVWGDTQSREMDWASTKN